MSQNNTDKKKPTAEDIKAVKDKRDIVVKNNTTVKK